MYPGLQTTSGLEGGSGPRELHTTARHGQKGKLSASDGIIDHRGALAVEHVSPCHQEGDTPPYTIALWAIL